MVRSTVKPTEIKIIRVRDDIAKGTFYVQYAFRFGIREKTIETVDATGTAVQSKVYEYEEYIAEMELPLALKSVLSDTLIGLYKQIVPKLMENLNYASVGIPPEIKVE